MFCYTELHILLKNSILTLILSFLLLSFISSELIFQKKKTILCCIQRVAQRKFSWLFEGFHPRNKIFKIKLRWHKTQLPTPLQMVARLLIVTDRNEFKPLEKSYQATGKKTLPSFFFNLWSGFFFLILPEKGKLTVLSRINFTRRQWNNVAFPTLNSAKFWLRLSMFLWKITKVFHDENFLYNQFFVTMKISSCVTQSG